MNILFVVSTPEAGRVLLPMAAACRRKGITWGFFLLMTVFRYSLIRRLWKQRVVLNARWYVNTHGLALWVIRIARRSLAVKRKTA